MLTSRPSDIDLHILVQLILQRQNLHKLLSSWAFDLYYRFYWFRVHHNAKFKHTNILAILTLDENLSQIVWVRSQKIQLNWKNFCILICLQRHVIAISLLWYSCNLGKLTWCTSFVHILGLHLWILSWKFVLYWKDWWGLNVVWVSLNVEDDVGWPWLLLELNVLVHEVFVLRLFKPLHVDRFCF